MQEQYVYIIVRKDLAWPQIAVQSAHSVLESAIKFNDPRSQAERSRQIQNIILLEVDDEKSLLEASKYLDNHEIAHILFREPDIGNCATALATNILYQESRKLFRNFKLLR